MIRTITVALAVTAIAATLSAQAPFRLKDTNTAISVSRGGTAFGFMSLGDSVLFRARDEVHGVELWKTDGTEAGTSFLKDINVGFGDGYTRTSGITMSGSAFFEGTDASTGAELWKTDGTSAGTLRVADLCPGPCGSIPRRFISSGGLIYFVADESMSASHLWRTDGSSAGTQRIGVSPAGPLPLVSEVVDFNGTVFFSGADDSHSGLWRVKDGTASIFVATSPGPYFPPSGLTVIGNRLFYTAYASGGYRTFVTDGVNPPVTLLDHGAGRLTQYSYSDAAFMGLGSLVFFPSAGPSGLTLWVTDGTPAGTHLVSDVAQGPTFTYDGGGATVLGNYLYFGGATGTAHGLWRTDGTTVSLVTNPCAEGNPNAIGPTGYTTIGDAVYFEAAGCGAPYQTLWRSDGTPEGTSSITMVGALPYTPVALNGGVLFSGYDAVGFDPWFTTGTAASTVRVKDINPPTTSSEVIGFAGNGARGSAFAALSEAGTRLWVSNGTTSTTGVLIGPPVADYGSAGRPLFLNGSYFFAAAGTTTGLELWKSDGTTDGTVLVKDVCAGSCSSNPQFLTAVNGTLYFVANDEVHGFELWTSDGTEAGTAMVKDINPGTPSSLSIFTSPQLTRVGSSVYFIANDGSTGTEVWKTDGTSDGTARVVDITPGLGGTSLSSFGDVNGTLFFRANNQVWKTDGTTSLPLVTFAYAASSLGSIAELNGIAIFRGGDGTEIWKSDGTPVGTSKIIDINIEPYLTTLFDPERANALVRLGNAVYFAIDDGLHGRELWKTDGVSASVVADICPGACASRPTRFTVVGDKLFFQANDGMTGEELWSTDGTEVNTKLVADIEPGSGGSQPVDITPSASLLYFTATTLAEGRDAYVACLTETAQYTLSIGADRVVSGTEFPLTVTARDASGSIVPCYTGSVTFTTDDHAASIPSVQEFTAGEGTLTVPVMFRAVGEHTITAADTATGAIVQSIAVTVEHPGPRK